MNQSTITPSKSRFRPIKLVAAGIPGGPLPANSVAQSPSARPAIIRTVVGSENNGQPATVRLMRQDEMSLPKPRMLSEERLERYVQNLRASETKNAAVDQSSISNSIVTWSTPQASRALNLSEATLIRPQATHHAHSAHTDPEPHLRTWPKEAEAAAAVEAQLEQASQLDEQLNQLELRIDQLKSKEAAISAVEQSAREQAILTNPQTSELVTAISTAIVSAIQEKSEEDVLPQAKSIFEKSLQQHTVTLGDLNDSVAAAETSASEAMFSSIAAHRQETLPPATISNTLSPTALVEQLRQRIADYQRTMTSQTATEAANLVKLSAAKPAMAPLDENAAIETVDPPESVMDSLASQGQPPAVQFTSPENAAIPFKAASWDVEDFRWSAITNQMLDSGSSAVGQLLEVAMGRTAAKTKRIAVAGAGRGQGTTTIATSLARAAIDAGYKTLLIDADVASPDLSQTVGLAANMSWLNGIGTDFPLGETVIRSKKSNLCLMPLSATVKRVTWPRFIFDNLGEMLVKAESYFDLILIDAGPASQLLDELSSPEYLLDTMVLVDATAKAKDIEVYQNRLQTFGIDNLVLAENRRSASAVDAA